MDKSIDRRQPYCAVNGEIFGFCMEAGLGHPTHNVAFHMHPALSRLMPYGYSETDVSASFTSLHVTGHLPYRHIPPPKKTTNADIFPLVGVRVLRLGSRSGLLGLGLGLLGRKRMHAVHGCCGCNICSVVCLCVCGSQP